MLNLNLEGMTFVLTSLFVVLTIEQYFNSSVRFPFVAAVGAGAASLILFSPDNMLLISIILGTLILMGREKLIQGDLNMNKGIKKAHSAAAQPVKVRKDQGGELMAEALQMLVTIMVVALATFATGFFLSYVLDQESRRKCFLLLKKTCRHDPLAAGNLLLKRCQWFCSPYGVPELFTIGVVAGCTSGKKRHAQHLCRHGPIHGTCAAKCLFFPL
jgi:branched-subunit amino acid transport protein AzlD